MQAGNAQIGRTILAALTAAVLVMSMVFLLANPADAVHQSPIEVKGNANCNAATGLTEVLRLEGNELADGTYAFDVGTGSVTIDITNDKTSFDWSSTDSIAAIFVKGGNSGNLYDYRPGGATSDTGLTAPPGPQGQLQEISHITFCIPDTATTTTSTTVPEETTTTVPEETTTTVPEETTTTVPEETTTTVPEETTTTVPEETTTTIPDEVLALVFVTVDGKCVVDDGKGKGEITVTVSVDDAATVVIKDGDGDVVATVTEDTVVTVPEDDTYTWEATPAEGFEFAEDFVASGEVDIDECTPEEVKDLEVLPFTGVETEALAIIASVLSAIGLLVLLATRRVEN
jgi:hypothetical protein